MKFLVALILFFLISYYLLKLVGKALLPFIIKNLSKQDPYSGHAKSKKKGQVDVTHNPGKKKIISKKEGEYIAYKKVNEH